MKFNSITFWDFREKYHNKFIGDNNFNKLITKLSTKKNIYFGITKYNFYCIKKYIETIIKKPIKELYDFKIKPVNSIYKRFLIYFKNINTIIKKYNYSLAGPEYALLIILKNIQDEWNRENNNDLLRILGVLAETVFIGPHILHIDMSNTCNIDCLYCWFHSPKIKRKQIERHVPFNRFRELIDQAKKIDIEEILLLGEGEPFMDNNIVSHIEYIKKKNLKLELFTNGTLVNKKASDIIIKNNVDHIYFSISAATTKTYKKLHPSTHIKTFNNIMKDLEYFASLKTNNNIPRMTYLFVVNNLNFHEIYKTVKLAIYLKFNSVRFQLIHGGDNDFNSYLFLNNEQILKAKKLLKQAKELAFKNNIDIFDNIDFQLPNLNSNSGNWSEDFYIKHGCFIGWYLLFFRQQGHFSFCCAPKIVSENKYENIEKLWFSDKYNKYRNAAKNMNENKNIKFENNENLFSYNCQRCENYDHINKLISLLKKLKLLKYVKE